MGAYVIYDQTDAENARRAAASVAHLWSPKVATRRWLKEGGKPSEAVFADCKHKNDVTRRGYGDFYRTAYSAATMPRFIEGEAAHAAYVAAGCARHLQHKEGEPWTKEDMTFYPPHAIESAINALVGSIAPTSSEEECFDDDQGQRDIYEDVPLARTRQVLVTALRAVYGTADQEVADKMFHHVWNREE